MTKPKSTRANEAGYAFRIATHDPETTKRGRIADREVYDRRFSIGEVQEIADRVRARALERVDAGEPFGVRDEVEIFASVLSRRVADERGPITADELLDVLTEDEYGQVVRHFAPSLMDANQAATAGKARSSAK